MKKIVSLVMAILAYASLASANSFVNGGFETGNLAGWTGGGGNWSAYGSTGTPTYVPFTGGALPGAASYNGGTSNNTIVSVGTDPITGQSRVYNGNYSVRANDSNNNYSVSTLRQSVLNYTDKDIFFEWNAVLEGSHGTTDSDYFSLTLRDDTANQVLISRSYSSASAANIFTYINGWYGSGWQVEHIDVAGLNAIGHDFTLTLLASDCPYGGHAGYVYLDGFAPVVVDPGPGTPVPEPSTFLLLGIGLAGAAFARKRIKK